jgi:hypothetical protein
MMSFVGLGFFYKSSLLEAQQNIQEMAQDGLLWLTLLWLACMTLSTVLNLCRKKENGLSSGQKEASLIELLLSTTADPHSNTAEVNLTPSSSKLTDQEIIDNIKIFLFAGEKKVRPLLY